MATIIKIRRGIRRKRSLQVEPTTDLLSIIVRVGGEEQVIKGEDIEILLPDDVEFEEAEEVEEDMDLDLKEPEEIEETEM